MDSAAGVATFFVSITAGIALFIEAGWRWGRGDRAKGEGESAIGIYHASVSGLLGLLLAFTFSAAEGHLELRRQQIVAEGNYVSTAYQRVGLLAPEDRGELRRLFRLYLDARARVYENLTDRTATSAAVAAAAELGDRIWRGAAAVCEKAQKRSACILILQETNAMIDEADARTEALDMRTPPAILLLLLGLAPLSGLLAGYVSAAQARRSRAHSFLYALAVALIVTVILDLDNPRYGLIRLTGPQERVTAMLRAAMAEP